MILLKHILYPHEIILNEICSTELINFNLFTVCSEIHQNLSYLTMETDRTGLFNWFVNCYINSLFKYFIIFKCGFLNKHTFTYVHTCSCVGT